MAGQKCLVIFACLVLHFTNAQYFDEKPDNPFDETRASITNSYLPPAESAPKPSNAYLPAEGSASNQQGLYLPPDRSGSSSDSDNVVLAPPGDGRDEEPAPDQQVPKIAPQLGCAAALLCVEEQYCTMTGVISESPVRLSEAQLLRSVPMVDCRNPETGVIGKCCRDPNYEDPWPNGGNLPPNYKGGFDNNGFPLIFNYNYTSTQKPVTARPTQSAPIRIQQPTFPDSSIQLNRPVLPPKIVAQPNFPSPSSTPFPRPAPSQSTFPRPISQQPSFQRPSVSPQPFIQKPVSPQPTIPNFIGSGSNVNKAEIPTYSEEEKDISGQEILSANQALVPDIYKNSVVGQRPKPLGHSVQTFPNIQSIQQGRPTYGSEDNSVIGSPFSH